MRPDSSNERDSANHFSSAPSRDVAVSPLIGANSTIPPHNNNLSTVNENLNDFIDEERGGGGDDVVVKEEGGIILSSNDQYLQDEETSSVSLSDNTSCPSIPNSTLLFPTHHQQQLMLSGDFEWDVKEFLENSEKLRFITQIETASVVLDKESTEFKLLHSLIYELSKTAATFCPFVEASDPRTSQFFSNVFDTFWSHVPFLQQLHVDGVLPGNKATSKYKNLKSLLRWKMQKNFGVLMKKYNVRCRT